MDKYVWSFVVFAEPREQVPFSMFKGKAGLVHERFSKHLRMGSASMKYDIEKEEEEKSKYAKKHLGQEKTCYDGLTVARSHPPNKVATPEAVNELPKEVNIRL